VGQGAVSVFVSDAIHGGYLRKLLLVILVSIFFVGSSFAQKNDIALTGGGYLEVTNPLNLGAAWALEGSYARRFAGVPLLSLSWELPVAGSSGSSIPTISGFNIATSYSSLFITPGLRVRLAPSFFLSPYVAAGVGLGHFNKTLITGVNTSNNTWAIDIGGGLDMKILPHTSLRGEIRDFNSGGLDIPGVPSLLSSTVGGRLNNLFITAGISIKF
jgi:opacity protein-like surface antigen